MRISQELYKSGILGHHQNRGATHWEYLDPGLPSYHARRTDNGDTRRAPRRSRGWRAIANVFSRRP